MARLNVVLCDLCKKISKTDSPATLKAVKGRGDDKQVISAELCSDCFDSLKAKIDTVVNLDTLTGAPTKRHEYPGEPGNTPHELRTPIASRRRPELNACKHLNSDFKHPFITCRDCGNQEKTD